MPTCTRKIWRNLHWQKWLNKKIAQETQKMDIAKNFRKCFTKFSYWFPFWIYLHMVVTFTYSKHIFITKLLWFFFMFQCFLSIYLTKMIGHLLCARRCSKRWVHTSVNPKRSISWCLQTIWGRRTMTNSSRMLKWNSSLFSLFCTVVQEHGRTSQHTVGENGNHPS